MMDVLGFKHLFSNLGLCEIYNKYAELISKVRMHTGTGTDIIRLPDGGIAMGTITIDYAYFSDTILFWMKYNWLSLPTFTNVMSEIICCGLEQSLPLRGTMVIGEMILDKESNLFLVQPIIEAAETERLQKWIGVSIGTSFKEHNHQGFYLDTVLPYKSHFADQDNSLVTGMVVDWPRKWRASRKEDVRVIVAGMDVDKNYSIYYGNTTRFIEFSEKNYDWFKKQKHLSYG
ncbi:MAG: hypothetical protein HY097_06040 [Nitrospinae bacterium]|nr:hypothetical protein [Nitrospinota bacterium]